MFLGQTMDPSPEGGVPLGRRSPRSRGPYCAPINNQVAQSHNDELRMVSAAYVQPFVKRQKNG